MNPYLPLWEYIPDGEPRVFGDRVYIYGSHDRAGACEFCDIKLKCWSAPVDCSCIVKTSLVMCPFVGQVSYSLFLNWV